MSFEYNEIFTKEKLDLYLKPGVNIKRIFQILLGF